MTLIPSSLPSGLLPLAGAGPVPAEQGLFAALFADLARRGDQNAPADPAVAGLEQGPTGDADGALSDPDPVDPPDGAESASAENAVRDLPVGAGQQVVPPNRPAGEAEGTGTAVTQPGIAHTGMVQAVPNEIAHAARDTPPAPDLRIVDGAESAWATASTIANPNAARPAVEVPQRNIRDLPGADLDRGATRHATSAPGDPGQPVTLGAPAAGMKIRSGTPAPSSTGLVAGQGPAAVDIGTGAVTVLDTGVPGQSTPDPTPKSSDQTVANRPASTGEDGHGTLPLVRAQSAQVTAPVLPPPIMRHPFPSAPPSPAPAASLQPPSMPDALTLVAATPVSGLQTVPPVTEHTRVDGRRADGTGAARQATPATPQGPVERALADWPRAASRLAPSADPLSADPLSGPVRAATGAVGVTGATAATSVIVPAGLPDGSRQETPQGKVVAVSPMSPALAGSSGLIALANVSASSADSDARRLVRAVPDRFVAPLRSEAPPAPSGADVAIRVAAPWPPAPVPSATVPNPVSALIGADPLPAQTAPGDEGHGTGLQSFGPLAGPAASTPVFAHTAVSPAATAETARAIAMQIVAHPVAQGRGFDLALHPEELGRIRIALTATDAGSVLVIQVERPETLDLMRRHIAQLEQDLRALGHDRLSLNFAQSNAGDHGGDHGGDPSGDRGQSPSRDSPQPDSQTLAMQTPAYRSRSGAALTTDHLDIRL